jgi:hypothetical protein
VKGARIEVCEQVNGIQYFGITASYTATLKVKDIFGRGYTSCMCPMFAIVTQPSAAHVFLEATSVALHSQ